MNFSKIKKPLLENITDIQALQHLLKNAIGAKFVDILFYDKKEKIFFDKINKTRIERKYLDKKSVIGHVFMMKKPHYSSNIIKEKRYDLPLDNPFKLEIFDQIIIPIFKDNEPKGILRFSMLPLGFSSSDYRSFLRLQSIFTQIFLVNNDIAQTSIQEKEANSVEIIFSQIENLFEKLLAKSVNPETAKLVEQGQSNIKAIAHYFCLEESGSAQESFAKINMGKILDKKINANVLIADDVHINVKILNAMLSGDKYIDQIKYAYDGIETVEVIKNCRDNQESIHILFLDHHMPGMLGSEIAELLKSKNEFKGEVIIVSITNDPEAIKNQNHYYDYHIPKPFTKKNVQEVMEKIKENHLDKKY